MEIKVKGQYIIDLERQLDRLWVGSNHVCVVKLGKDKFSLTDGKRSCRAHGSKLMRAIKPLRDRCGSEKFWSALEPLGVHVNPNVELVITTED